jgi:hypothetical protein
MHIHSNTSGVEELDIGVKNPHFNPLKRVVINIEIMLTKKNIDKGMVNGVLTIVENIGFDIHHKVDVTTIMLEHSKLQLKMKRCTIKFSFTSKGRF